MLTNQIFHPSPFFGVGPELFYLPQSSMYLDISVITALRTLQTEGMSFNLVYFGVARGGKFPDPTTARAQIERFGVDTSDIVVFDNVNAASHYHAMIRLCDFVYAPEFSTKVTIPSARRVTVDRGSFLGALSFSLGTVSGYSPVQFRKLLDI